jgi:DNA-binding transcriptional MerR regulator
MEREDERPLLIGEAARLTGFSTKTLRFYDDLGLVRPGARTEAGYRLYGPEELAKLGFVKQAKLIGLRLDEIAELVGLAAEGKQGEVVHRLEGILESKMEETRQRMAELAEFQEHLLHYRRRTLEADRRRRRGCDSSAGSATRTDTSQASALRGPYLPHAPYSPEYVEGAFCELRAEGVLRSSHSPGSAEVS